MIQADAEGVIDFKQARPFDLRWWQYLELMSEHLARKNRARLFESKLSQNLAVLDYGLGDASFDYHWNQANFIRAQIGEILAPWMELGPKEPEEIAEQMTEQYKEEFGDPEDPEYDAKIEALIQQWVQEGMEA
jgi:hypothetical protein